ncbi:hypothetical protein V5O48_017203 [Marasmius crinis-equi]|uniref:Uncharacterized protein n=1 Tax=Marasmius crinis-equi TaxID=585013 RepID=A0ABR3EPM4_9AGAR
MLVQIHQSKTVLSDILNALMEYWLFIKQDSLAPTDPTALSTTAKSIDRPTCDNCGVAGDFRAKCWAAGGGAEGKALKWWKAPKGKEPRTKVAATTTASPSIDIQSSANISHTNTVAPTAAATTTAYTPLETYCLGDFMVNNLDCDGKILEW